VIYKYLSSIALNKLFVAVKLKVERYQTHVDTLTRICI
jgi:hypothetical protein